jgi:hypothetical protein
MHIIKYSLASSHPPHPPPSQDFYFSSVAAPLTSADPEYWQFVKRVEFIVAGALSLAPEDAVTFVRFVHTLLCV